MSSFLGMTRVSDWPDGARPQNYREGILWLYPNGKAALTALLALTKKNQIDDYQFNWYTQTFPEQRGAITAGEIYTDVALSSAYTSGGTEGQTLYVKSTAAVQSEFRPGHEVLLRNSADLAMDVVAKCVASVANGSSSYVACKLLEADDNSSNSDLSDADSIRIIGNINAQGATTPNAISYQPTKFTNKTQIFRTPLEIARTTMKLRSRLGNTYANLKMLALELHSVEMEWAFLFGVNTENTGANGQPETTMEGLITFLRNNLSTQVVSYKRDTNYSGKTWLDGGDDWLLDQLELLTRFSEKGGGQSNYAVLAGSGTLKHLERLARQNGQIQMVSGKTLGFGINVTQWVTSFGTYPIITHPLFSQDPTMRNTMLILKPSNIWYNYIDDTQFYNQARKSYGYTISGKRIDGLNEEFLTECSLEYHHPQTALFLYDIGDTNIA